MWTLTACRTFSQELVSFLTAATRMFFSFKWRLETSSLLHRRSFGARTFWEKKEKILLVRLLKERNGLAVSGTTSILLFSRSTKRKEGLESGSGREQGYRWWMNSLSLRLLESSLGSYLHLGEDSRRRRVQP